MTPILIAFVIGTPLLAFISYQAARVTSMVAFASTHPEQGPYFWRIHYEAQLGEPGQLLPLGTWWLVLKTIACGIGVAAIAFHRGMRPKASASDVSDGITSTVLWATLYVLVVHFAVAFLEF
jgi:ABC-type transporter Mla maintaining outer membrane lipid asymmetry permease subunit MlaE